MRRVVIGVVGGRRQRRTARDPAFCFFARGLGSCVSRSRAAFRSRRVSLAADPRRRDRGRVLGRAHDGLRAPHDGDGARVGPLLHRRHRGSVPCAVFTRLSSWACWGGRSRLQWAAGEKRWCAIYLHRRPLEPEDCAARQRARHVGRRARHHDDDRRDGQLDRAAVRRLHGHRRRGRLRDRVQGRPDRAAADRRRVPLARRHRRGRDRGRRLRGAPRRPDQRPPRVGRSARGACVIARHASPCRALPSCRRGAAPRALFCACHTLTRQRFGGGCAALCSLGPFQPWK